MIKKVFLFVRSIITMILFGLAAYFSFDLISYAISSKTTTTSLHLPMQYMYASIPVGLVLMTLYAAYHVVRHGKLTIGKKSDSSAPADTIEE